MLFFRRLILLLCACSGSFFLFAQIKLPAIISDHMILQQQSKAALWGWAQPGEKITVKTGWSPNAITTVADANGKWMVYVPTAKAGGPYAINFSGSNSIEVKDVLLGEVWLASG